MSTKKKKEHMGCTQHKSTAIDDPPIQSSPPARHANKDYCKGKVQPSATNANATASTENDRGRSTNTTNSVAGYTQTPRTPKDIIPIVSPDVELVGWITVNQCKVIDIPCLEVESGKKIAWYYTSNISAVPSEWCRITDDEPEARIKPSKNSKSLNICLTYRTDNGIYLYQAEDTNTYFGWNFTVSEHKIKENGIIIVELGSNVTLPCLIRNELQHIVWKFMPQMNVCEQIDMEVSGDTNSIKILNLKSSDIGVYEYQAEYMRMETEYFSWKLSHVPIVEVHVDSNQVKTKTDKTIYCKVIGDMGDCSNITWHLQPYDKPEHSINLKATNKYFVGPKQEPSLTILQFDSTDVGVYKCLAFNTENLVGESKPVKLIQNQKVCFVLFGPIGGGKSSVGNIFLQKESFPRRVSVKEISFTLNIEQIEEEVEYKRIAVIDTPGVRTSMGQENINKTVGMLKKAAGMGSPGPDAFLLVLSLESNLDRTFFNCFTKLKEKELKYVIVIFTTFRTRTETREELLNFFPVEVTNIFLKYNLKYFIVNINYESIESVIENVRQTTADIIKYCTETRKIENPAKFECNYYKV